MKKGLELVILVSLFTGFVMFLAGYLLRANKEEYVMFTYEEIQMIEDFQTRLEDSLGKDVQVLVYKDKKGKVMLSWK